MKKEMEVGRKPAAQQRYNIHHPADILVSSSSSYFNSILKPTLFAESGGRGTGERQTVPPKAERMVLLEVALEMLEVALN